MSKKEAFVEYLKANNYADGTVRDYPRGIERIDEQIQTHLPELRHYGLLYNISSSAVLKDIKDRWSAVTSTKVRESRQHKSFTSAFDRYIEFIDHLGK